MAIRLIVIVVLSLFLSHTLSYSEWARTEYGPVSSRDNRVLKGPLGRPVARYVRSLAPLTPLTRSAALRFATLASLARFARSLRSRARSLTSLTPSWDS